MKKLKSIVLGMTLAVSMTLSVASVTDVYASTYLENSKKVSGSSFTSSDQMASKLNKIFKGNAGVSKSGKNVKVPLGCSKLNASNMYSVRNKTTGDVVSGWQCYIYANGVYNTLFNECVLHGDTALEHSIKVVSSGIKTLSYKKLKKAGIKCGAYLRTTVNSNGKFNSEGGHSIIILSYDSSKITYLEGNGDGKGRVRIAVKSWSEFNSSQLSGLSRRICYIIQPTDKYYDSLYGEDISLSVKDSGKDYSTELTKKTDTLYKTTAYTGQKIKLAVKGTKSKVKWTTSKKSVATVSKKGKITIKKKGKVTITAVLVDKKIKCKFTVKNPPVSEPRPVQVTDEESDIK